MAKRFSSGLQSMKFMQRGETAKKEAEKKQRDEDQHWVVASAASTSSGRCVVIMEDDPKPAAPMGRMSFGNYNPSIDKLHDEIRERRSNAKTKAEESQQNQKTDSKAAKIENSASISAETPSIDPENPRDETERASKKHKTDQQQQQQKHYPKPISQNRFDAIRSQGFRKPPKF